MLFALFRGATLTCVIRDPWFILSIPYLRFVGNTETSSGKRPFLTNIPKPRIIQLESQENGYRNCSHRIAKSRPYSPDLAIRWEQLR